MSDFTRLITFSGGIVNNVSDELIPDDALADARNVMPDPAGGGNIRKRPGYDTTQAAGATTHSVYGIWIGALNEYYTTYKAGSNYRIYDLLSGVALYNSATAATDSYWATLDSVDYVNTSEHALKTTDGSAFAAWTDPSGTTGVAKPYVLATYNNMMFAAPAFGATTVYWSAAGNPESWSTTQAYDFPQTSLTANNNYSVGLIPFRDKLVYFTYGSMFHIQGYTATSITVPYWRYDVGLVNPKAVTDTPYGLVWWDTVHGICISPDGYDVQFPMQRTIPATLNDIRDNVGMQDCHCVYRPDLRCVRFFVGYDSANLNHRIDYYPETGTFWLQDLSTGMPNDIRASCVWSKLDPSDGNVYEFASYGQAVLREGTTPNDNGSNVECWLKTKRFSGPVGVLQEKRLVDVAVTLWAADTGTPIYGYYADNATASATRALNISVVAGINDKRIGCHAYYRKIQHYLSDSLPLSLTEFHSLNEAGQFERKP